MRPALAPTAAADVLVGRCHQGPLDAAEIPTLALLCVSSMALYSAGMVLNDVFDAGRDRRLHPARPIPSGAISRPQAATWGTALLLAGVVLALAAGRVTQAGLVAVAVLAYDGILKRWTLPGALGMAACRLLNVGMGAGAALCLPGIATFGYVALLTLVSTTEDGPEDPGAFAVYGWALVWAAPAAALATPAPALALPALATLGLVLAHRVRASRSGPAGPAAFDLVRVSLFGLLLLDAGILFGYKRPLPALAVLLSYPVCRALGAACRPAATRRPS